MPVITTFAVSLLEQFIRDADRRPPHCAVDRVLGMAQRMELDQGGRLTDFQARTFAALLLGAQRHPPGAADPEIVPEWLTPEDAARFEAEAAKTLPDARSPSSLTSH
jgi:hypothetical protein